MVKSISYGRIVKANLSCNPTPVKFRWLIASLSVVQSTLTSSDKNQT